MALVSKAELAKALGTTVRSITTWKKLSGAPKDRSDGKYNLEHWKKFHKSEELKGSERDSRRKQQIFDREDLRIAQQRIDLERKQLELDLRKGDLLPVAPIHDCLNSLAMMMRAMIKELREDGHVIAAKLVEETIQRFDRVIDDQFKTSSR